MMLGTISSADECADKIIKFINSHTPGAQELVIFLSGIISLPPHFFKHVIWFFLYPFSGVEEATKGEVPVD